MSEGQDGLIWDSELKAFVLPGTNIDQESDDDFEFPNIDDTVEESEIFSQTFTVHAFGLQNRTYSYGEILQFADQRIIKPSTILQQTGTELIFTASNVPGVFSEQKYVVALLLSWFFGVLGFDRFYLGYIKLGIFKLLTIGGLGIWALIDFILIATRSVRDGQGRPLA